MRQQTDLLIRMIYLQVKRFYCLSFHFICYNCYKTKNNSYYRKKRRGVMNRLSFIVLHSIVAISIAIIGFLSIPEKTYASNSFSDNARCFVRSKQEKGKVFTAKSDEAKLKITNINPAQEIKEIALYDAKTKQRVKRNYGVYKKGETISYQNLKKNKKYYLVFKLNKKSSNR